MKEDGGNVLQWNRTLSVLCEPPGLQVFPGSVLDTLFVILRAFCPHAWLVAAALSFILTVCTLFSKTQPGRELFYCSTWLLDFPLD